MTYQCLDKIYYPLHDIYGKYKTEIEAQRKQKIENSAEYKRIKQKRDQVAQKQIDEKAKVSQQESNNGMTFEASYDNPEDNKVLDRFEKALQKHRSVFLCDEDFENKEKFMQYIEDYADTHYGPLVEEFENQAYFIKDFEDIMTERIPPKAKLTSFKLIKHS